MDVIYYNMLNVKPKVLTHSLTHLLTHSPTHSLTHSLTYPLKDKAQKSSYLLYEQKERELKFEDDRKSIENSKLLEEKAAIDAKLPAFIESLISCNPEVIVSKQDAMDKSCVFLQEYLGLPAVYMAGMDT